MFVMPENDIPKGGYLEITFPSSSFTPTSCHAWSLTGAANLKYPGDKATTRILGTIAGSAPTFYCTWASALSGGTAYGIHFDAAASTLTAGQYAPVALESHAGKGASAYNGPVIDSNSAFDAITVAPVANTFTIAGAATADVTDCGKNTSMPKCNSKFNNPGETMSIEWTLSAFTGFAATESIYAPFDIAITFKAIANAAVSKHVYENWAWVATCTNTQWGKKTTDAAGKEVIPKASTLTPTCVATTTKLVISITKDSVTPGADWANFKMGWTISVK